MGSSSVKDGIVECNLKGWKEFTGFVTAVLPDTPAYIFRGQANASWVVESTLDRIENRFLKHRATGSPGATVLLDGPPVDRDVHLRAYQQAAREKRGVEPTEIVALGMVGSCPTSWLGDANA